MRRTILILSVAMVTAGCVVLADAAVTLAWKEPVSALYNSFKQGDAQDELAAATAEFDRESPADAGEPAVDPEVLTARRARRLAGGFQRRMRTGAGIGRIRISSAGIDYIVVAGTDTDTLKRGPGHYPTTGLPGSGATIGIAGHRTTYGAPFRKIDAVDVGDAIEVQMPYGNFTYEVEKTKIVAPTDVHIVRPVGRERLVLTACHPLYSAAERYAVFGRLVSTADLARPGA